MNHELGFIGGGNMAEAVVRAALANRVLPAEAMAVADPSAERRAAMAALGVAVFADNAQAIDGARQVLLAVKPQTMAQAAADLARHGRPEQVVISILAGVSTTKLAAAIAAAGGILNRIVRVMPNTPLQVGRGMAGVAVGAGAKPGDESLAMKLFSAGGKAIVVGEELLDAITAVSGSGPAYVFYLAEAMERAAADLGLADHARTLVRQTILGAAELLAQSSDSPAELRRKVSSPGGTTEAAVRHLDGNAAAEVIVNAVKAAQQRSLELGA